MRFWRLVMIAAVLVASGVVVTLASCSPKQSVEPITVTIGWKEDFDPAKGLAGSIPKDWQVAKKPGTRPAEFSIIAAENGSHALHLEADKASASLMIQIQNVDLDKTPVLRWRWRVGVLPKDGDGRTPAKDDQAIGIYIGTGSMLNKKSISYRWDTDTPKGAEGNVNYGGGTVKVKWFTLRNKDDAPNGEWITEERNVREDFTRAYGFCPDKLYIGISCNSQYTGTSAQADLAWIELVSIKNGDQRLE